MIETPVRETPVVAEPTTPIRPSEALRLGRLRYPRRIEGEFADGGPGRCAIGAIYAGLGIEYPSPGDAADVLVREASRRTGGCPVCGELDEGGKHTIAHLNDEHHWQDDQIVAWLESLGL